MDGISFLQPLSPELQEMLYERGNAHGWLARSCKTAAVNYQLAGRLYVSKTGYLLLSVPNALVRGVFDAMTATGAELPTMSAFKGESAEGDLLNAHITVMTDKEVEQIGKDKINERGHTFRYSLGPIREFSPRTESLSRVWAIEANSPELAALRRSYGLTPLPNEDHQFHITVAVRRKRVLAFNEVSKIDGTRGELKAAADILHGGRADNMPDSKFSKKELIAGVADEHEHTDNDQIAKEIAKDHLQEDPQYYKKQEELDKQAKNEPAIILKLREAKAHSDAKRYDRKNAILRDLMTKAPNEWYVDDPLPYHMGVTHDPTKFKFHADPVIIPSGVKVRAKVAETEPYLAQLKATPIAYNKDESVWRNFVNHLMKVKSNGDQQLYTQQRSDSLLRALDPARQQQHYAAIARGEAPKQPSIATQIIHRHGGNVLASL